MTDKQRRKLSDDFAANLRARRKPYYVHALALMALLLIAAGLSMVTLLAGIFFICFICVPYLYAYTILSADESSSEAPTHRQTLQAFAHYYSGGVFGVYRLLLNLLKSVGIYLLAYVLSMIIYGLIANQVDTLFHDEFAQVLSFYQNADTDGVYNALLNAVALTRWINICQLISVGVTVFSFSLFLSAYAMNPYMQAFCQGFPISFTNTLYNHYYPYVRGEYRCARLAHCYGGAFLTLAVYGIGACTAMLLRWPDYTVVGFALALTAVVLALRMPRTMSLLVVFWKHTKKQMIRARLDLAKEIQARAYGIPNMRSEDLEHINADVESMEQMLRNYDEESNED